MSARRGPERVETARLVLRRPQASEANPIFARYRAMTGYVLARDAGGRGNATEALGAMVETARMLGVRRLYALCHHEHRASARVLEKCGFMREGVPRSYSEFPNLKPGEPQDVLSCAVLL